MSAWLHLRKSRYLNDPDDPKLLENHREILLALARADGLEESGLEIIREVESGEFLDRRPEFLALLEEWERLPPASGGVLYTMAMSRLSRGDPQERGRVRVALRRAGIVVRTPSGTYDLADRTQSLLVGVQSELSEYELAEYKDRMEQSRNAKLLRGELLTNVVPFGYRYSKDRERVEIEPTEFPILQACCREIRAASLRRLSQKYGIREWTLHRALRSPTICGYAVRRYRREKVNRKGVYSRLLPRSEWRWAARPGPWPAACSRSEWEAIQRVLDERRRKPHWTNNEDGWCREALQFVGAPPGHVRLDVSHGYGEYAWVTEDKHRWGGIRRSEVHQVVAKCLLARLSCPLTLARIAEAHRSYLQAEASRNGSRASVEALQQQIEEKRAALSRLVREAALAEGEEIRAARYQVQKELQEEIRALARRIEPAEAAAASDLPALIEEMIPIAAGMAAEWPNFPGPLKQALVRAFIQSVPVELGESRHGVRRPFTILPVVWQPWAEED